ncbi:MAG: hypothetical protein ACTS8Z_05795 [Candidatus Limnocylindrales bacterium]
MMRRQGAVVLLAVIAAIGLLGFPVGPAAPSDVHAATPDLTIVGSARYDVQPTEQRIRVTVDLTLTNRLKDTRTKLYYFDYAPLDILPRASNIRVSSASGNPSVRITSQTKDYTRLRIDLGARLRSGKTTKLKLTFSLVDPGGVPARDLRVGDSLVSFPVWAFASDATPGSSVTVVFPAGYQVTTEIGAFPPATPGDDGRTILRSGTLDKPLEFFAYLVADRPGAYDESTVSTTVLDVPVDIKLRAWSDDAPWAKRVGGLIDRALPALGARIGLPWPDYDQPLTVQEAVSRSTGGYAGLFDPSQARVEIAYYADDFVVLHEAAHAWFNGSLLADRWASEAFASYYGSAAAFDLKVKVQTDAITETLEKSRIPLNDWGPVGTEDVAEEDYAYAAGLALARLIAERAGPGGLQKVWADAAERIGAYQPVGGGEETVADAPDWRGLLDLLEARTDAAYHDLWREWVARPVDLPLLDARAAAREHYATVLDRAEDWRLPKPVRDALRAWQFDDATALLDDADAILTARTEVEASAGRAGLIAPATLRSAFENDDGFEDAEAEVTAELDTIERFTTAAALRPVELTPLLSLGLWGEVPEDHLDAARDAFARGDLPAAAHASDAAAAIWGGAETIGQGRAFSVITIAVAIVMLLALLVTTARRRRRRRVRMQATRIGS